MADFGGFNSGNSGGLDAAGNPISTANQIAGGLGALNQNINPILNDPNTTNAQKLTALANSGLSADQISAQSGLTPQQLQQTYGYTGAPTINPEISQAYQTLFGRAADTAGAQYWAGTGLTGQNLLNAMGAGAQGSDINAYKQYLTKQPLTALNLPQTNTCTGYQRPNDAFDTIEGTYDPNAPAVAAATAGLDVVSPDKGPYVAPTSNVTTTFNNYGNWLWNYIS